MNINRYLSNVRPRFWALLLAGLVVALVVVIVAGQSYLAGKDATIARLNDDLAAMKEVTAALQDKYDYTFTDEYIEREARGSLGLIYEDETLYQLGGVTESAGE